MRRSSALVCLLGFCLIADAFRTASAQCALPHQLTNGQMADATQVMANFNALVACLGAAPGGSTNAIQFNAGSGSLGGVGPLTDGQVVVGSTGNAPQAATLTGGSGISVTNGPGSITISGTGATFQREFGPFAPPDASSFTFIDTPLSITPTVTSVTDVGLVYSVPIFNGSSYAFPGAYQAVPTTAPWTITVRASYAAMMGDYPSFGIWLKDTSGKMLGEIMESRGGTANIVIKRNNSSTNYNNNPYVSNISGIPQWFRVNYDGTNINFYVSWDSQNWLQTWTETSTTFLNGNLQYVGIGGFPGISNTSTWRAGSKMGAVVTYWNVAQ